MFEMFSTAAPDPFGHVTDRKLTAKRDAASRDTPHFANATESVLEHGVFSHVTFSCKLCSRQFVRMTRRLEFDSITFSF